ncbi:MAG: hypothetical protein M3Y27_19015 [Acidobacteriota bacterium]|nr:hypothetical protein [Acidobacteriota bacterium]
MSASFFAAQSCIEMAFATLQSGEVPDTAAIGQAVSAAIQKIAEADALDASESAGIANAALRLAENLREFLVALDLPGQAALSKLYDEFADEAECLALGTDVDLKASADRIRADIASGQVASYPDRISSA